VEEEVQFQEVLVLEMVGAGVQALSFLSSEEVAVGLEEFFLLSPGSGGGGGGDGAAGPAVLDEVEGGGGGGGGGPFEVEA